MNIKGENMKKASNKVNVAEILKKYAEPEHPEEVVPTIINDCETDEDFETLSTLNID